VDSKSVRGLSIDDLIDRISGPAGSTITLTIQRQGLDHQLEFSLRREVIRIQVVKQRMEPDQIGYVRLAEFTEPANDALKNAIKSLKRQALASLGHWSSTFATIQVAFWIRLLLSPATS
jgi:carboxyl-terminal processing protease